VLCALLPVSTHIWAQQSAQPAPQQKIGAGGFIMPQDIDPGGAATPAGSLDGGELIFQQQDDPVLVSPDAATYQFYIADLESREGPYAPGLSEQLLGLGAAYQDQGLHAEAVRAFKRGVHLSRINNGLYSADQIPLLQRLITSHIANGEYEEADERQYYLYRVQRKLYQPGAPQLASAMLDRAEWQRQAYFLSVGDVAFTRLLSMWELYRTVLGNIAQSEGSYSRSLLDPLNGLLETQYLISTYSGESTSGFEVNASEGSTGVEEGRFNMVRLSNYKQGQSVITAMREVYTFNEPEESPLPAETLVKLGDWHFWHRKRESAITSYQQAWDELAALPEGDDYIEAVFSQPVLLPNGPDSPTEIEPPEVISGYAQVSYTVSDRGRVENLELLGAEPLEKDGPVETMQLMRQLRASTYRPRFEDRQPVDTETIVKRYAY
jgi:tetratricopeptide (TPR) repeat protein